VPNQRPNNFSEMASESPNPYRKPVAKELELKMDKLDAFTEIYLWNLNMDRLIRVLDRLKPHSIRSPRGLKVYAIRLEEIRAGLNADFAEVMAVRERADEYRYWFWRTAAERQKERPN
jgi:hypothetical protein